MRNRTHRNSVFPDRGGNRNDPEEAGRPDGHQESSVPASLLPETSERSGGEVQIDGRGLDASLTSLRDNRPNPSGHYERLAVTVMAEAMSRGFKKVLIASPHAGEGRTTVTLNLAGALARAGQRVLVVDCDFERPSITRLLGIEKDISRPDSKEWTPRTGADRLRILPWGIDVLTLRDKVADPVRVLTSPGFSGMINLLAADYDVVLFDSSPMLEAAHWQLVAQITDKMLLVVRPGATSVSEMGLAVRQLSQDDILGVVLNHVQN